MVNRAKKFNLSDFDHIIFSYHGIPERHVDKVYLDGKPCADHQCDKEINHENKHCYKAACYATSRLLVEALSLEDGTYSTCFQSRLGRDPWLKPYTDDELKRLASEGKKKLVIVTPAFVTDCLETLEEIKMEGKEDFIDAGGEEYYYIDCLNDDKEWANVIAKWIKKDFGI